MSRNPGSNRGPTQKFVSQPSKRLRTCSDSDVSQNLSQDLQELSDLLDNLSKNEDLVKQAASLILNKPALRHNILDKLVSDTNDLKSRTRNIEDRLDDLEQYSRKLCLKFSGIPENIDEDTDTLILNTVNNFLLPPEHNKLDKFAICNSHRLGPPRRHGQTRPRDIIVRFVRYRDRASVYNNKKNLKGFNDNKNNGYRIFVNEALTRRRSALFSKARQVVRSGEAKGTWTYDGKIYLRRNDGKKVIVRHEEDLHKFDQESARVNSDMYEESDPANATSEDELSPKRGSCYSDAVKRNTPVK